MWQITREGEEAPETPRFRQSRDTREQDDLLFCEELWFKSEMGVSESPGTGLCSKEHEAGQTKQARNQQIFQGVCRSEQAITMLAYG